MNNDDVLAAVRDPGRLRALWDLGLLDSDAEPAFDRLTRLASLLLETPVALVSLVDADRQFFKSQVGLSEPWASRRETPLTHSFCKYVVTSGEALVVSDSAGHPLVGDNGATADLGVAAYAGMPLRLGQGAVLGALCTIDGKPRNWTERQLGILKDLAATVVTEIELRAELQSRHEVELELRAAKARAEQANRAKSVFLTNMSHELRTPLNSVIGFARVLRGTLPGVASERDLELLGRIDDNGRHLLELIDGLLDLAKIESGRLESRAVELDLAVLVREVTEQLESQAAGRAVRLATRIPEGLATLQADPRFLRQVLFNLVGNAVKFTNEGDVTVRVDCDADRRPHSLSVIDSGVGIPVECHASVFEKFEQADNSTARQYGGSGLGLAISRALAEEMGFSLRLAASEPGRGSTFTVDFA